MAQTTEEKREEVEGAGEAGAEGGGPPRGLLREYFESGVVTVVMALFFMTFVAQAAEVPSASMENTIYVGDRFLINKFIFAPGPHAFFLPQREVRRGDIIVFKYPAKSVPSQQIVQYKTLFIKRVIGLPGDRIEVRGPNVYINDQLLPEYRVTALDVLSSDKSELKQLRHPPRRGDEPYAVYYKPETMAAGDNAPAPRDFEFAVREPYEVPAGHYFVMGDNRDNSADSRYWGPVPRELIVGRGMFVIWSFDSSLPRSDGLGVIRDFFTNTRWSRIGTMLR
jgi:signal peptidase I